MQSLQDLISELSSGDDQRAEAALPAIQSLGMAAQPALLKLTRSKSPDARWWAVRALAASPQTHAEDLIPLLGDSAPEVRSAAALAICEHPHEKAVPALIHLLADSDPLAAGLAGNALVKIGAPAVENLLELMKEAVGPVRIHALRALAEICDHRAIPVLMKVMSEESAVLQYWAQYGLEKLGLDMVYIKP